MWKLSQLYLSDFRAGDNFMDDGLIKALDDTGKSRDCLIFSPNGTFKTSLLAIALSQLSPSKDRFIQTLQSSSKKIEDYVILQRPALVMTKFVSSLDQENLFGDIDSDILIVGQLFFLRQSSSSNYKHELERLFFMSRNESTFDQVRQLFLELRTERSGWDQLRKEIAKFTEIEDTQRDWLKMLDTAGLDPFLVDKQVEMCKEEGGIANTLEFSDEKAFMSFFLNATMDIERSTDLHGNVLRGMDKHRNMPQRKRELKAANRLMEILQTFEQTAGKWRGLEVERQRYASQIGEAAYILEKALPQAKHAKATADKKADEVEQQRRDAQRTQHEALADKNLINQEGYRRQKEQLWSEKNECIQKLSSTKAELIALDGGTLTSAVDTKQQTMTTTEQAFKAANAELAPMKKRLDDTQVAFYARLTFEKHQLGKEMRAKESELDGVVQKKKEDEKSLNKNRDDLNLCQQKQARMKNSVESAEKARFSLQLESGESPLEGLTRLLEEQKVREEHIAVHIDRRSQAKQAVEQLQKSIQAESEQRDKKQAEADQITNWLAEEQRARKTVLENELLAVLAGSVDFNPYTSELASALSDAINRQESKADLAHSKVLKLKEDIEQLSDATTLGEDPLTGSLLEHYLNEGVSDAKLRSFSEYLDSRFDGNVEKIAQLMSSDPARFGGLVAMDQVTLQQVADIEAPDWLLRPVTVSLAEPLEANNNPHLVIEPLDLTVYSSRALERRREELSLELGEAREQEVETKTKYKRFVEAEKLRSELLSRFISLDHIEAQRQEEQALIAASITTTNSLNRYNEELIGKLAAIEESEHLERELREQKEKTTEALTEVKSWLTQFSSLEQWRDELEELATDIANKTETIGTLVEQISSLGEQAFELTRAAQDCRSQLKTLMSNVPVPAPGGGAELPEAPNSSLQVLQEAYFEADRALNQAATENGISALEEKLRSARSELSSALEAWNSYYDQQKPDLELVKKWKGVGDLERTQEKSNFENKLITLQSSKETLLGKLDENSAKFQDAKERLDKHCRAQKVKPSLDPEAIREQNIDALKQQVSSRYKRAESECKRLESRASKLRADIDLVQNWKGKLSIAQARIGGHRPIDSQGNDSLDWPLLTVGQLVDRVKASERFEEIVKDLRDQLDVTDNRLKEEQYSLEKNFAQVKRQIEHKSISDPLFDLVQKLLNTDASSFAYQTDDFVEKCDRVIRNLKMDVEAMDQHVSGLVKSLIDHASDCYQVLIEASSARVPNSVPVYGSQKILDIKTRLDFIKHKEAYHDAMLNWFYDVVEKGSLPQANAKKGDELGTSLLYRLLGCTGRQVRPGFDIGLLKMAGQAQRYVPISEDLSSGGERLTSATMLYSVISHVRSRQRQHIASGNGVGFLFMDNPLSKASKASFVQAQLHTCKAFDIQPIFVTGVGDIAALEQFSNRIVITKSDGSDGRPKNVKINNEIFTRVVITEELLTEEFV